MQPESSMPLHQKLHALHNQDMANQFKLLMLINFVHFTLSIRVPTTADLLSKHLSDLKT